MAGVVDTGRFVGPTHALLRIVTGLLFLQHGTAKLLGFPQTNMMPAAGSLPWIAGVMELVGGVLIIIGLFTRPVAFLLSGLMAVAYWMAHAPQSTFPIQNGGELAILYCFVFLYLAAAGAGPWSVDGSIGRRRVTVYEEGPVDVRR
ncbi:DoxX family protein [Sphingomonas sp. LY29]|uniref:DoxX family protein n=1 Tax=Sphingomonas sp. LY29 TaxID=3095341 RepID=UPI002D79B86E|nr:DoxX family protein [Sphingomonas sp. LY29]WRP26116.1 DoxX family protein [Sphingomonas sp. LY29]